MFILTQNYQYSKHNENKANLPCKYYTSYGICTQPFCLYSHDPTHVALCPRMQSNKNHKCLDKSCHYSHKPTQFNSPSCKFFQIGKCTNNDCIFTHKLEDQSSPICRPFACLKYCESGLNCKFIHSFNCPDVKEYGRCLDPNDCNCLHNSDLIENDMKLITRNEDNDNVVSIVYDSNNDDKEGKDKNDYNNNDNNMSDSDDENVEFIVGPVGDSISDNKNYVSL